MWNPPTTHLVGNGTYDPSWPALLAPLMRWSRTCALLSVWNMSRYERLHNKLSLICVSDAIMPVLFCFFWPLHPLLLSLATSESVFYRKAAPRQLGIQDAASSHQCSLNYFCFKSATNFHIMAFRRFTKNVRDVKGCSFFCCCHAT